MKVKIISNKFYSDQQHLGIFLIYIKSYPFIGFSFFSMSIDLIHYPNKCSISKIKYAFWGTINKQNNMVVQNS